jgi:phage baseplate assembly protein W
MAELGSDIAGVFDVDATLSVATGRRALAQAILRRLTTPRGGLIDSPAYGYDVTALIGSAVPPSIVEQRVLEQVVAEQEVKDARCTVTFTRDTLTVDIQVEEGDGPFSLTLTASELTIQAFLDGTLFAEAA